jgi:hypothetical protein
LKSVSRSEPFRTLGEVIAPFRTCFAPTLFRFSDTAATDVPPRAMNTATLAMTFA